MTIYEPKLPGKQMIGEKIHVITKSTVTLPPHHISIIPLISINYPNKKHTDTLLEIEGKPILYHQTTGSHNNTLITET